MGCWKLNLDLIHTRQAPYLLYYFSSPEQGFLKSEGKIGGGGEAFPSSEKESSQRASSTV